jgi:uncharacterized protein (DUF3084 family)
VTLPFAVLSPDLGGAATIVMIIVVAGAIAYFGDRVGHVVGRRRMTLFNLRPKYTSTIFAVGFGMLIAIVVVAFLLVVSSEARQALFSINKLNDQITQLSAERDQLLDSPVIFRAGEAITQPFIIKSTDPLPVIERELSDLFVAVANVSRSLPVQPYAKNPLTAPARASIHAAAVGIKTQAPLEAIVVPEASENIIRGGVLRIGLRVYPNKLLYRKGETIASVGVANGQSRDEDRAALVQLIAGLKLSAISHDMPPSIADNPITSVDAIDSSIAALTSSRGPTVVRAVAANDIDAAGPLTANLVVSPVAVK